MKIYIASFFDDRIRLHEPAAKLWALGHEVVSSWLYEVHKPDGMTQVEFEMKLAIKDLTEIEAADLVIIDTMSITPRGGREVEYGYALRSHQRTLEFIVGPVRNIFHRLADRQFDDWEQCIAHIKSRGGVCHTLAKS